MVNINKNKIRRVVASVDWGFTNAGIIQVWAVDGDGRMYMVHEVYQSKQLIGWWVEKAKAIHAHYRVEKFVCDPAEPGFINEFSIAHLPTIPAFNDIRLGIQAVQERMTVGGDGLPRLFVMIGCLSNRDEMLAEAKKPVCLVDEIDGYSWPKGQDGKAVKEVPVDADNHACDAMRYAVAYVDRLGTGPVSGAPVIGGPSRAPSNVLTPQRPAPGRIPIPGAGRRF